MVISANIGNFDNVIENHYPNPDWQYFLFTDNNIKSKCWNIIKVDRICEPRRQSRIYKWLAHQYFPDAEYSLYIDCNFKIIVDINSLITSDFDILMRPHQGRICLYEEAEVCRKLKLDYSQTIDKQIAKIRNSGYPENNGLHEGGVILRRHTNEVKEFGDGVWNMISKGSHRDQLALDYVAWELGLKIGNLPIKHFEYYGHKKGRRTYLW